MDCADTTWIEQYQLRNRLSRRDWNAHVESSDDFSGRVDLTAVSNHTDEGDFTLIAGDAVLIEVLASESQRGCARDGDGVLSDGSIRSISLVLAVCRIVTRAWIDGSIGIHDAYINERYLERDGMAFQDRVAGHFSSLANVGSILVDQGKYVEHAHTRDVCPEHSAC